MLIRYDTNNSGGRWWLKNEDWYKLEKAGWKIDWYRERDDDWGLHKKGTFLGAEAAGAEKEFNSPQEAIKEFETITGQDVSEEGCNCCGAPHTFSFYNDESDYEVYSGEDILDLLYKDKPESMREACERLNK